MRKKKKLLIVLEKIMETHEEKAMRLLDEYETLLNKSIQMNYELMKTLKKMIGEKNEQDE